MSCILITLFVILLSSPSHARDQCLKVFKPDPHEFFDAAVFPDDPEWMVALFDRRIQAQKFQMLPMNPQVIEWLQTIARINQEYPITTLEKDSGLIEVSYDVWDRYVKDDFDEVLQWLQNTEITRTNQGEGKTIIGRDKIPFLINASKDSVEERYSLEVERSIIEFMLKFEEPAYYYHSIENGWYLLSRRYLRPPAPVY